MIDKDSDSEDVSTIYEIMKEDASEIIKKMESQIPVFFQSYSDMYKQYLHLLDDVFGTCYIAEKEFFNKLNLPPVVLKQIKDNSELMKNAYIKNLDVSTKMFDDYNKMRTDAIKSFDTWIHIMMDSYARMLSQFNKLTDSKD